MLHEGTFPKLKRKRLKYFYFDECFKKDASEEDKREALREIYQSILRNYRGGGSCMPENILNLKIAVASSVYRDLKSSIKAAEVLCCSQSDLIKYTPQEIKMKAPKAAAEEADKKFKEVVDRIGPCFYKDIRVELKLTRRIVIRRAQILRAKGEIEITKTISGGRSGSSTYTTFELLDGLSFNKSPKNMVWNPRNVEHRKKMVEIYKEAILASGPMESGKKKALTSRLKGTRRLKGLPEDIFNELHEWYLAL